MHRTWGVAGLLAAAVVLGGIVTMTAPAGAGGGGDAGRASWLPSDGTAVDPDRVVIEVEIRPDGTARWKVRYRVRLDNQSVTDAFESVRADVETNKLNYSGAFKDRLEPAVTAAENETGREMGLYNVTVGADADSPPGLSGTYGVIAYDFEWTGFGTVEDGRVRAGDALGGYFLSEDATMLVSWPDRYRVVNVNPPSDEDRNASVVWKGPKEFTADGPRVVLEPTGPPTGPRLPVSAAWLAAAGLLAVLLAAGFYRLRETSDETPEGPSTAADADGGDADGDALAAGRDADEEAAGTAPEELLSDEERVVRLLEEHGGRMKQQSVVEELDWSETKTSQVVKELHEDEKIERYRLGRENVLALPGEMDV